MSENPEFVEEAQKAKSAMDSSIQSALVAHGAFNHIFGKAAALVDELEEYVEEDEAE